MNDDEIWISFKKFLKVIILVCALFTFVLFFVMVDSPKFMPEKTYVDSPSEEISVSSQPESSNESNQKLTVEINTATSEELQLIPNIGPATAKLIIDYRNECGTILSLDELLSIDGIGKKTVEILKEYCIIN